MNKKDLILAASTATGMQQKEVEQALNAILECIGQSLKKDEPVILVGFGSFSIQERASRTGINPTTKERIQIPAKKVVKFKAGKTLAIDSEK